MNSDERQLITDLFDRMAGHGLAEKDAQAAALISERVRAMPDAPYMLVQSVLVQEMALQQADERIRALEAQVSEMEQQRVPAASSGGGSFLGGLFGGGQAERPAARPQASPAVRSGSVPAMGQRPMAGARSQSGASPWGNAAGGSPGAAQAGSAGGGFMRSAMATAAGVAGGMLLADGIRNMMNGDAAKPATTDTAAADAAADAETDAEVDQAGHEDPASNDPGYQDAGYDDGGSDFGGDFDV